MERAIVTSRLALRMPSEPATEQDVALAQDLLDTLAAHANECVGLAANMVGVRRRVIAISDNGNNQAMLNPTILEKTAPYQTEEGCLSLPGR
ncbi:MAG: peptide deformylase, partial [Coriobacteriales bacterium]|nr:peptide deformylase [Coriobacteriales bacterium]